MVGSSSAVAGLRPIRALKSASASYGAARFPYARRSANRTTRRRSGWNASATATVATSDHQNPPPVVSSTVRPSSTTRPT